MHMASGPNSFYDGPLVGARILVVDDEDLTVRAINRVLARCGAIVVSRNSVAEARVVIEEGAMPFDAAVVDYQLLNDDRGTEILELLRSGSYPCCTMMITGSHDPENGRRAFQAGAEDFLLKPFPVPDFIDVLESLVERTMHRRARIAGTPYNPLRPTGAPFKELNPSEHVPHMTGGRRDRHGKQAEVLEEQIRLIADKAGLSKREREVVGRVLRGKKNIDISAELGITTRTVKFHVRNILKKCDVSQRTGLMALLWKKDLPAWNPQLERASKARDDKSEDAE